MATESPLLFAPHGSQDHAARVARRLGCRLAAHEVRPFEDGEHQSRPLAYSAFLYRSKCREYFIGSHFRPPLTQINVLTGKKAQTKKMHSSVGQNFQPEGLSSR